jgi:hypothetical protein
VWGVLVEWVMEAYYTMDADMMKDINLELTSLSLALDWTRAHLSLTYDNMVRAQGKVDSNAGMGMWVHNKMGQWFSVVVALFQGQGGAPEP